VLKGLGITNTSYGRPVAEKKLNQKKDLSSLKKDLSSLRRVKFMLSKTSFSLFVIGLFVFGVGLLIQPQSASAGAVVMGCCINNSGNCAGGCGSEASNCQTEQLGSCPNEEETAENCNGVLDLVRCFVPGGVCNQDTNTKGTCSEGPPTDPQGCQDAGECPNLDPECVDAVCTDGNCSTTPREGSDENPNCNPPPAAPTAIIPTMGQWGMLLAAMVLGIFAIIRLRSLKDSELS